MAWDICGMGLIDLLMWS